METFLFTGTALKTLEDEKGVIVRFVIGRRYEVFMFTSYFVLPLGWLIEVFV